MKKFAWFFALLMSMLFISCFEEENFGYPKNIVFGKNGGEQIVKGNVSFTHAEIVNHKTGEDSEIQENEMCAVRALDWLKIEYTDTIAGTCNLKIYAEPNTSGKARQLCIEVYSAMEYQEIKVKQEK